ncbi:MAG: UTP--glucose-1-phosphate uridylyltransferase GalU [Gammaproteobacteria bacterium]|nr:UTP--glucose-1-phosphate uridylyltransferase GalU [Gammaproteobacteria bacterium]
MTQKIRKAVFPVAGLGTRFLPATKANPKEMLPIVDKPLVQYAAEEAVAAGITELIFVTGRNKRAIPDHFDKAYELESELEASGKTQKLEEIRSILPPEVNCIYVRQAEALGLGHAVLKARSVVGNEPFAVILADDLIVADGPGCLAQMTARFDEVGHSILGVEQVESSRIGAYGVVELARPDDEGPCYELTGLVEKPKPADAPSDLGVVGRYVLTPRIFDVLESTAYGAGNELQLTDAIANLLRYERVSAYRFKGTRYDCGSKLGYLQANVELALKHPDVSTDFREWLQELAL